MTCLLLSLVNAFVLMDNEHTWTTILWWDKGNDRHIREYPRVKSMGYDTWGAKKYIS